MRLLIYVFLSAVCDAGCLRRPYMTARLAPGIRGARIEIGHMTRVGIVTMPSGIPLIYFSICPAPSTVLLMGYFAT